MKLIQKIRTWYHNRKDPKKLFPNQKNLIEYAFTVGGIDYYQFNDTFNQPYERALFALAVYEQARMRCSREYLEKHVEVVRGILQSNKIDIFKLNMLNEQMSERLNLVIDVELLYQLASIVFFDKKENPAIYELDYCNKKIEHWKAHKGVADFFLQMPIIELMPFLESVEIDLDIYSELNTELNKIHLERLSM